MSAPLTFDRDDAYQAVTVAIGLCELAATAARSPEPALTPEPFEAVACLLTKARRVIHDEMMVGPRVRLSVAADGPEPAR